jgi:glycosyltransferase involved in cell wall biosynthesis
VKARSRVQWVLGEQTLLPPLAVRHGVQLMHSLASTAPLWGPFTRVTTVHDLIYAHFPDAHPGIREKGMSVLVPQAARRSERVMADSSSTREDLVELIGIAPERIDVVPLGLGSLQREPPTPERELRARFELGERPIVLSLSAKRPHKNLSALIGALARLPPEERPLLVLPGYGTWHEGELQQRAERGGIAEDVRLCGWVSTADLEGLWAIAEAFIFPSLYEGFGLPVLEAMARGVPVACSNTSSLPEVAGEAALLFDPREETQIAEALRRILTDGELRGRLRALGRARSQLFTWERTARLTLESYSRALNSSQHP